MLGMHTSNLRFSHELKYPDAFHVLVPRHNETSTRVAGFRFEHETCEVVLERSSTEKGQLMAHTLIGQQPNVPPPSQDIRRAHADILPCALIWTTTDARTSESRSVE